MDPAGGNISIIWKIIQNKQVQQEFYKAGKYVMIFWDKNKERNEAVSHLP